MGLLCSLLEIKRLLLQSAARRVAARGQLLRTNKPLAPDRPAQKLRLGPWREKVRCTRGEGAQASGCLSRLPQGEKARRIQGTAQARKGTKRRRNRIRAFVEYPKTGTALNAGPAPYRAAGSLSTVNGESTDTPVQGKPSVARTRGVLPTHSDICLQRPALPEAGLN